MSNENLYKHLSKADVHKAWENSKGMLEISHGSAHNKDIYGIIGSPSWNWPSYNYTIALKTKDGLYVHEFLQKLEAGESMATPTDYELGSLTLRDQIIQDPLNVIPDLEIIKNDPEYRPFATRMELIKFMLDNYPQIVCKNSGDICTINATEGNIVEVRLCNEYGLYEYEELLKRFTSLCGDPLGVKK